MDLELAIQTILDTKPERDLARMLRYMLYDIYNKREEQKFPEDKELLKAIPGIPGYMISTFGNVYSVKQRKFLKYFISKSGYKTATFSVSGKNIKKMIHRLVAQTFKPEQEREDFVVNHLDHNRLNNHINNLSWTSYSNNNLHSRPRNVVSVKNKRHKQKEIKIES